MFREVSIDEIELVSGGSAGSSSCDDQSGYFWSEMSTMDYDIYQQQRLEDLQDYLAEQYPWLTTEIDGNDIVVTAGLQENWTGTEFWAGPNGQLFTNPYQCEVAHVQAIWEANSSFGPEAAFWPVAALESFYWVKGFDPGWVRENMPEWWDANVNNANCEPMPNGAYQQENMIP